MLFVVSFGCSLNSKYYAPVFKRFVLRFASCSFRTLSLVIILRYQRAWLYITERLQWLGWKDSMCRSAQVTVRFTYDVLSSIPFLLKNIVVSRKLISLFEYLMSNLIVACELLR